MLSLNFKRNFAFPWPGLWASHMMMLPGCWRWQVHHHWRRAHWPRTLPIRICALRDATPSEYQIPYSAGMEKEFTCPQIKAVNKSSQGGRCHPQHYKVSLDLGKHVLQWWGTISEIRNPWPMRQTPIFAEPLSISFPRHLLGDYPVSQIPLFGSQIFAAIPPALYTMCMVSHNTQIICILHIRRHLTWEHWIAGLRNRYVSAATLV